MRSSPAATARRERGAPSRPVRWGAPPLPGDHGAYAMLGVPLALGYLSALLRPGTPPDLPAVGWALFAVALLAFFAAGEPGAAAFKPRAPAATRARARRWLAVDLATGLLATAPLLLVWQRWALLAFGLPAAALLGAFLLAVRRRRQRSLAIRLPGIAALTLSGPAGYYVATGRLDAFAWGLWAVCAVYIAGTVFNVRAWFEAHRQIQAGIAHPGLSGGLQAAIAAYTGASVVILGAAILFGALPGAVVLAFVPAAARLGWSVLAPPGQLPIKQIGLIEFGQSFLFAGLVLWAAA